MKIAIIGRSEVLYDTALELMNMGHEIVCILTAKEAPEYTRTAQDYRELAQKWGIPFSQGPKISEQKEFLSGTLADIAVSINYTGVVPQSVIDLFPMGVLNAHGGDLPRYRGNACQAWAIINGEKKIGLCVHKMIGNELDSGDIIARDYLPIGINTKIGEVWAWIVSQTPKLMVEAINNLTIDSNYILERQSKDIKSALRCYPRKPEDGRIEWSKSALEILRLINASSKPYAGAFCELESKRMIIWEATLGADNENYCAVPGQVMAIAEEFIEVACGLGKLRISKVEYLNGECSPSSLVKSIRARLK